MIADNLCIYFKPFILNLHLFPIEQVYLVYHFYYHNFVLYVFRAPGWLIVNCLMIQLKNVD
jgi:hypothetical protein